MDVTQLPISQIVPHDKEVRLAKKVNALVDALERYNLADRAGDDYQWLVRYKDWIVDDFHNVFNPLDNSTVNERKSAYVEGFIHPDRYKVMYDKLKELGSVKDYIASLRTDSEKASSQKKYSLLELEKKDQLKLSRLRREKLDYIERMKIEAYEAVKEGDYLIFTTLTSTPGFERVFNSGNPAVKKFTYQFAHDVAAAYLIAAGKKNTDEARRPILWDVCRYLRVFEYGDKNGRKHAHIFWRIKALPHYIANPHEVNRFSATDLRETLPGMSALWPHISTHQPLRYGGDAWTAAGFQWPKEIDANGAVVQKQVKPVDACISYVGAYINQATETELALRTYNILNKNDNVYNVKYDQEETIPCRVKPSRGFGKLRVRQLIATAPLSRLKELLPASPHLTMPPPTTEQAFAELEAAENRAIAEAGERRNLETFLPGTTASAQFISSRLDRPDEADKDALLRPEEQWAFSSSRYKKYGRL